MNPHEAQLKADTFAAMKLLLPPGTTDEALSAITRSILTGVLGVCDLAIARGEDIHQLRLHIEQIFANFSKDARH